MNKYFIIAGICFIVAILCFAESARSGEESLHFFLIFPIITVNSLLSGIGALLILLTFVFAIIGFLKGFELVSWDEFQGEYSESSQPEKKEDGSARPTATRKTRIEGGGVVLLGPIPIIFGSNQKLTVILVVLTLAIMVVALLFFMK